MLWPLGMSGKLTGTLIVWVPFAYKDVLASVGGIDWPSTAGKPSSSHLLSMSNPSMSV